tara:strand:- start:185 stop:385 length:201 start_codon:yes stop_codon:yes gene_type:complete
VDKQERVEQAIRIATQKFNRLLAAKVFGGAEFDKLQSVIASLSNDLADIQDEKGYEKFEGDSRGDN